MEGFSFSHRRVMNTEMVILQFKWQFSIYQTQSFNHHSRHNPTPKANISHPKQLCFKQSIHCKLYGVWHYQLWVWHVSEKCTAIVRFRMVKKLFPQNTFFSWFFTARAFIIYSLLYHKTCLGISIGPLKHLKTAKNVNFWKMENYSFWPKSWHFFAQRWSKTMYDNVFG